MIDGRSLSQGEILEADLCIVGGGPAGLTLASTFIGSGISVILVETGGEKQDKQTDALSGGASKSDKYAPLTMYRRRMLGGASVIWGGRCVPYDAIDFEARDYAPNTGWPYPKSVLDPYYDQATEISDAGAPEYDADVAVPNAPEFIKGFKSDIVLTRNFERFSLPTNFWRKLGPALSAAGNIKIVTQATCTRLVVGAALGQIERAELSTFAGTKFFVKARRFVVAGGGIETYRLLAASNDVYRNGVGNENDVLGRYFMSHIEGNVAELRLSDPKRPVYWKFDMAEGGIYCRRRLSIAQDEQRRHQLLNTILRLHHPNAVNPLHGNAVLSMMFLAKSFILAEYRRKITMVERSAVDALPKGMAFWGKHFSNIVLGAPGLAFFLADWIARRNIATRKIPYVVLPSKQGVFPLDFNSEQIPNPESRILSSSEQDRFGVPFAVVDWKMTETDVRSVASTFRLIKSELESSGIGTVDFGAGKLEDRIASDAVPIGGHHIGLTRMHTDAKFGVVDENLRVHGVDNLYIASGSVLPTSSHANPTLTILALTLKLADHLKSTAL
jgi:choline dehydrogenase-like flavoprotein